jgi:hypothetical protein
MFHQHTACEKAVPNKVSRDKYVAEIVDKSRLFSRTFLGMESLVKEVSDEVLSFPRWALTLGIAAVIVSVMAVYMPIAWSVWEDFLHTKQSNTERIGQLEREVKTLEAAQPSATSSPAAPPSVTMALS